MGKSYYCDKCGNGIRCQEKDVGTSVVVEPCRHCLRTAVADGYKAGKNKVIQEIMEPNND